MHRPLSHLQCLHALVLILAIGGVGFWNMDALTEPPEDAPGVGETLDADRFHPGSRRLFLLIVDSLPAGGAVDVASADSMGNWVEQCASELGGIDIFVSNVSAGGADASEDGWRANFETDMLSTWRGVQLVTPHLEKSSAGNIVVISSTAALGKAELKEQANLKEHITGHMISSLLLS